jgi:hypothetical protein
MIPETEELDVTGVKVTPSPPFEEFQGIVYLCGRVLISGLPQQSAPWWITLSKVVWNFSDWMLECFGRSLNIQLKSAISH